METVLTRFEPLLALALHAHGTEAGRSCSWDALASGIHALAERERNTAPPSGMTQKDLEPCRLAVYTLVDEVLFDSPRTAAPLSVMPSVAVLPGAETLLNTGTSALLNTGTPVRLNTDTPIRSSGIPNANTPTERGWYPHSLQERYIGNAFGGRVFYQQLDHLLDRLLDSIRNPDTDAIPVPGAQSDRSSLGQPLAFVSLPLVPEHEGDAVAVKHWQRVFDHWRQYGLPRHAADAQALQVFAHCLACGFQGLLHGSEHENERKALRQVACATLDLFLSLPQETEVTTLTQSMVAPAAHRGMRDMWDEHEPLLYLLLPVLIAVLWYFACADMVASIIVS